MNKNNNITYTCGMVHVTLQYQPSILQLQKIFHQKATWKRKTWILNPESHSHIIPCNAWPAVSRARSLHMLFTSGSHQRENLAAWKNSWEAHGRKGWTCAHVCWQTCWMKNFGLFGGCDASTLHGLGLTAFKRKTWSFFGQKNDKNVLVEIIV